MNRDASEKKFWKEDGDEEEGNSLFWPRRENIPLIFQERRRSGRMGGIPIGSDRTGPDRIGWDRMDPSMCGINDDDGFLKQKKTLQDGSPQMWQVIRFGNPLFTFNFFDGLAGGRAGGRLTFWRFFLKKYKLLLLQHIIIISASTTAVSEYKPFPQVTLLGK